MNSTNINERRRKTALILNSSQSKRPGGSDEWVVNTAAAVSWAIGKNLKVISSYGLSTYEFVTAIAANFGANILLVSHQPDILDNYKKQGLLDNFGLQTRRTEFVTVRGESSSPKSWWRVRDRAAVDMADIILPVSINPKGKLNKLLSEDTLREKINDKFRVEYDPHPQERFTPISKESLILSPTEPFDYITHWTHSFDGPWPHETKAEYYMSIIDSGNEYSHSAYRTLLAILRTRTLYGSSRHHRDGNRAIAFSSLHPSEAVKLMKWRRRYVRPTFEPYGISIERSYAELTGIRPVIYGTSDHYNELSESDKPFFQSAGEKRGDWKPEKEWRYIDDLDLSAIPPERIKVIVRNQSEIAGVAELTSSEVIALTNENRL